jgi:hypothetical protein
MTPNNLINIQIQFNSNLKMEAAVSSEKLKSTYRALHCHNSKDLCLNALIKLKTTLTYFYQQKSIRTFVFTA